jgi:rhamnogalacturonan acetylesterase
VKKNSIKKLSVIIVFLSVFLVSFIVIDHKPVLYIIGDSTVKNSDGSGRNGQWGWGTVIDVYFDTNRINIQNHAIGGRSSRTFITDGRWDKILQTLTKGDYVIMQFGHNDSGALDDTARARGTIKGVGNDSTEIYNPIRKMKEMVHSYGWYLRKFVNEAKAKGAIPIVCSPIPRDNRKEGKINRSEYGVWAKQIADETGAYFIDLQDRIALEYEKMDTAKVNSFFPADKTHTNKEGAILNAQQVVAGLKDLKKCELKNFLQK